MPQSTDGDANASIPTPQPVHFRPMFGCAGRAMHLTRHDVLSGLAIRSGLPAQLGLKQSDLK